MMVTLNKNYSNGEITVHWNPERCIHSGNCARSLNQVFNPRKKPWIDLSGATSDRIIETVNGCPSQALKFTAINENKE